MENKPLRVRLRKGKDDDIAKALKQAQKNEDKSDIVRAALRHYLLGEINITNEPIRQIEDETVEDVELEKIEKPDTNIDEELDDLLNNF